MNFNRFIIIFVLLFLNNCTNNVKITSKQFQESDKFTNKGFALIFNENLFKDDIISKRIDNRSYTIFQKNIKKNSDVKVTNLLNNKSLIAKVKSSKANYPLFFNSVITHTFVNGHLAYNNGNLDDSKLGMKINFNNEN